MKATTLRKAVAMALLLIPTAAINFGRIEATSKVVNSLSGSATGTHSPGVTDDRIESAVRTKLESLEGVDISKLRVEARDRTVTLSGQIDNAMQSQRIVDAVLGVRWVDNVVASFTIAGHRRPNSEIERDVEVALASDAGTSGQNINVSVYGGEVVLTGNVEAWAQRELATSLAAEVRGVRGVRNELTVPPSKRPHPEIKAAIERRFRGDPLVSNHIAVDVSDGKVSLRGEVNSALEKQWAVSDALAISAFPVDASGLRVDPWAGDRKTELRDERLSDEEIKQTITEAYVYDYRVGSFNPVVEVKDGVVTLSGTVDNLRAKQVAARIAEYTEGVKQVKNELALRAADASDSELKDRMRAAYARSMYVDPSDVQVTVNDGHVVLRGEVQSRLSELAVTDVASRLRGVKSVDNSLEVKGQPSSLLSSRSHPYPVRPGTPRAVHNSSFAGSDDQIRARVEDHLFWSPFADAEDIQVTANNGVVTLRGDVDSKAEKRAAEENAYEAGAKTVRNELKIVTID